MSYKNSTHYKTRLVELSMSSNQSITSTNATKVNFDTIRGDTGHGVSIVNNASGRIRLSGNRKYYIVGSTSMDKDNAGDQYSARWYNTSGSELGPTQGAFRSYGTSRITSGYGQRQFQCLSCQLVVDLASDTEYDLKVDGETGSLLKDGTMLFIIEMSKT